MEDVKALADAFANHSEPFTLRRAKLDARAFQESQLIVGQRSRNFVFRLVSEDGRRHLVIQFSLALPKEVIQDRICAFPRVSQELDHFAVDDAGVNQGHFPA